MITTTTTTNRAKASMPHGLNVREQGRLPRGPAAAALSSRERAGVLTERAFAGAPPSARSLVLELDRSQGLCVLAMGDRPAAVWSFELGALSALAARASSEVPRAVRCSRLSPAP